ncbi:MAG: helix-turn-helix domain containing protein [Desulfovibrio sp.]|jgi:hypothetical protein|nr:helix-turn-helix domain containing protein [Desulfovibrio sp.]
MPNIFSSSKTPHDDAELRFSRVLEAAGCQTQTELAAFFDIRQSSVADAKKRGSVPPDWLVKLVLYKLIHPHWVLTGEGPRMLQPVDAMAMPLPKLVYRVKPPEDCTVEELVTEVIRRSLENL